MTRPAGAQPAPPPPQKGGTSPVAWVQGMLCGAAVALATPAALLIGVLLLPGLAAIVLDRLPGRPVARTVLLYALAASLSPITRFWTQGHDMPTSVALITDPAVFGVAWMAGALGWTVCELAPVAVRLALDARSVTRAVWLRGKRRELEEEWGLPPAASGG